MWLRRRIRALLFTPGRAGELDWKSDVDGVEWDDEIVESLLDVYLETPDRYAEWQDAETFHGRGFSNGSWHVNEAAIRADYKTHGERIDCEHDERLSPTLEAWLKADIEGKLWRNGDPGGWATMTPEQRRRASQHRTCACGTRFVADRSSARKCDACRAAAREQRERGRGQPRGRRRQTP